MKKLLLALLFISSLAFGQATVLMPLPRFQAFDATGVPLLNGCLFTYSAGTNTPQPTYTDSTGGTPNANPVILDTLGSASIWMTTNQSYKLVLWSPGSPANATCSNGAQLWSQDNVNGFLTTITNLGGDAAINLVAGPHGGYVSTVDVAAVISNNNTGEMQFQIADSGPFGWRFCTLFGGSSCPFKIAAGAVDQFVDFGSTTNTVTIGATADTALQINGSGAGHSTGTGLYAITSGGHNGDARWLDTTATPYGFSMVFQAAGTTPFFLAGGAPTGSIHVNADGSTIVPNAVVTGTSSNTDQAGTCVLGTSCGPAVTFANTYAVAPICVATDQTGANAVKAVVTTSTLTLTGTGTDTLDYVCVPRH